MSENIPYGTQNPEPPAEPLTREEQYLSAIAGVTPATDIPPVPLTRVEKYLNKIVENGGGGGGGGTSNYNALENKPQINSHELSGDKSSSDLGLQDALTETQLAAVNSGITSSGLNWTLYYTQNADLQKAEVTHISASASRFVLFCWERKERLEIVTRTNNPNKK